jgi:hypothetical protein
MFRARFSPNPVLKGAIGEIPPETLIIIGSQNHAIIKNLILEVFVFLIRDHRNTSFLLKFAILNYKKGLFWDWSVHFCTNQTRL